MARSLFELRKSCVHSGFSKWSPSRKNAYYRQKGDHSNTELSMRSEFSSSWLHEINIMINTGNHKLHTRGTVGQVIVATAQDRAATVLERIDCRGWQSNKQLAICRLPDYFYSPRTIVSRLWRLIARRQLIPRNFEP